MLSITVVVALASGILDGVSMIGLTIRTLVIIMMLAAAPTASVRYVVPGMIAAQTAAPEPSTGQVPDRSMKMTTRRPIVGLLELDVRWESSPLPTWGGDRSSLGWRRFVRSRRECAQQTE